MSAFSFDDLQQVANTNDFDRAFWTLDLKDDEHNKGDWEVQRRNKQCANN